MADPPSCERGRSTACSFRSSVALGRSGQVQVLLTCAANCLISVVSTCLYYSELHHLNEFPFFATQLNTAIGALLAWLSLQAIGERACEPGREVGQRWLLLSACFSVQNTMEIASIPQLGNDNLPPILQQTVVPLSLVLSAMLLGKRFSWVQILGASLVVAGVVVGFLPNLLHASRPSSSVKASWVLVFLLSRVPQALANVLAERSLDSRPEFSWALRATLYTQLLALPCNFLFALLMSSFLNGSPFLVLEDYSGGAACVVKGVGGSDCEGAWQSVLFFAVPGMLYTVSEFQVLQATSAAAFFLLVALQLPLQDLALSALGGKRAAFELLFVHNKFRLASQVPSIVVVVLGLAAYGLGAKSSRDFQELQT